MQRGRARTIGAGIAVATVAAGLALVLAGPGRTPRPGEPDASGSAGASPGGPIVYYELVDAEASRLFARTLDGRSFPREIVARPDVGSGPSWSIDPGATLAVVIVGEARDGGRQDLVAYDLASGVQRWTTEIPVSFIDTAIWSADGRQLALTANSDLQEPPRILFVDSASGALRMADRPDGATVHGFAPDGGLILRERHVDETSNVVDWRFLRVDPATLATERLVALPDAPAGEAELEAAAPAMGVAVDVTGNGEEPGAVLRLWDLRQGTSRQLAVLPSIDRVSLDPNGGGVAVAAGDAVRYVALDGRASDVFEGPSSIADLGWSDHGDYALITTDGPPLALTVVERATGRVVAIPLTFPYGEVHFVRMVGGIPLPPEPLPAVEPTPTPTPGPAGPDIAGAPGLLASWVDRSGDRLLARAQRLVPTEEGGLRVAADMPPIDLGPTPVPDDGATAIRLLPRPGSTDILVWITTADGSSGQLWDGAAGLRPVALPPDWPSNTGDLAWRPDGKAIAASSGRSTPDGAFESVFVIASPGGRRTTVVPLVGPYDRLEGWWSPTELRVGHGICTEGCAGRYSDSARLRIADHHLLPMTPADRAKGAIDSGGFDGERIVLSMINDDTADDLTIDWPAALGPVSSVQTLFPTDARSLIVARSVVGATELYRVDDVVGRAVGGRLADPKPERIGVIAGITAEVTLSPDRAWALARDRLGSVRLVRLSDGRAWPIDRDRDLVWAP